MKCNRSISEAGRGTHIPVGECFVQLQISNKIFRERVIVIQNLKKDCILGQVLHGANQFGMGNSTNGRHYITLNGEMLVLSCLEIVTNPILKTKGKIKLLPSSISDIEVRMPEILDIYELGFCTFQLPEGVVPQDVLHCVDHKTPRTLKVIILNTNNTISNLERNSPIVTLVPAGKCEQIQEAKWSEVTQEPDLLKKPQLLPEIPSTTNLQLKPDIPNVSKSIPDADMLEIARKRLQGLLDLKYNSIVSKSAADIGRTNLIELDILTAGLQVASKPYTTPLTYR